MRRLLTFLGLLPMVLRADSVIVFNEVMYHPAGELDPGGEWVELVNQMAVDVDVSGWRLSGEVEWRFPERTVIPAGGYVVVAANPGPLPGALGPWQGRLSNREGTLTLRNNSDRVMDEIRWETSPAWPAAADGGGVSLAKRALRTDSAMASSWVASRMVGGTPGQENFPSFLPPVKTQLVPLGAEWKVLVGGTDPGAGWQSDGFDDAAWLGAPAGFQLGNDPLPPGVSAATPWPADGWTQYFRHRFRWAGGNGQLAATLELCVDDGAAVWLNGVEVLRTNLPPGPLTPETAAASVNRTAPALARFAVPAGLLRAGDNMLAVEVHRAAALEQGQPILFYTPGPSPAQARADGPFTVGSRIRTGNQAQSLTHLGVQDADAANDASDPDGADGLTGFADDDGFLNGAAGIQVGLWNASGALLASASVTSTDPWFAGWRYKSVTPVTLAANTDYFIGARVGAGIEWFLDNIGGAPLFAAEPGFTLALSTFATGGALARPASDGTLTVGRWGAANGLIGAPATLTVGPDTKDAVFAAALEVSESLPVPVLPPLVLNEVSPGQVEVMNAGTTAADTAGFIVRMVSGDVTADAPLPAQLLGGGAMLSIPITVPDGARLVLMGPDGMTVLDSFRAAGTVRGRFPDGIGPWLRLAAESPGQPNAVTLNRQVVISEIMYAPPAAALVPENTVMAGAWIELTNRSDRAADLSGWSLDRAVRYTFPAGTTLAAGARCVIAEVPAAVRLVHGLPEATVFGPWDGNLSGRGEEVLLRDAAGNPVSSVPYADDKPWPSAADGGGSSLELRDLRADERHPASWAASDESNRATWTTFTWRLTNAPGITGSPTLWKEINLLLADGPGSCLLDDIRVTDTVTGANLIVNGDFSAGTTGWRLLGNHRTSSVQPEPGNPGNPVLRLVASGPGEYQGNQIEATYAGNAALVTGRQYEVSLRARWLSGGARLNVRQYFDRLGRTQLIPIAANGGTPGAVNGTATAGIGPSLTGLRHFPVTPAADEPVTISLVADDPDAVAKVTLQYAVSGGPWLPVAMTRGSDGRYATQIPGQPSGSVQFFVEAEDAAGMISRAPAAGSASRAMYAIQDDRGSGTLQKLRLIMTPADAAFLHAPLNTLSNEELAATLIVDDRDVFYDIGVRLKGSFVGRNVTRVGFNLLFPADQPFRGVHRKVAVDRSQHATVGGVGEIIAKHMAAAAGDIPAMYDDLAQFVHPNPTYSGMCALRMAGFEKEFLDSQYPDGGDGVLIEMEVFRWNLNTVDGQPTSQKLPGNESGGTGYLNIDLGNYGNDKEAYRWFLLQTMRRGADDYSLVVPFSQMFSLNGAAFDTEMRRRIDHDAFLRTMAYQSLVGPGDAIFTGGAHHNCRFYFRPHDGRAVYMPWDWDSVWQRATGASLIGTGNLAKIVTVNQDATRRYYHHLYDLTQSTANSGYMTRWTQHYGKVSGQDFSSVLSYIAARYNYVRSQLPVSTAFTANAALPDANGAVLITGSSPISVHSIEVNGVRYSPFWIGTTTWRITVPLAAGPNSLAIRGVNRRGEPITGATASLSVSNPNQPGWPTLRINEWMAENDGFATDPADGAAADWFELHNPTDLTVNLAGWMLSDDPVAPAKFTIPAGWSIPPRGYLIVWADNQPAQNPASPNQGSQLHVPFRLSNAGETILLSAPDFRLVDEVSFGPARADEASGRYPDGNDTHDLMTLPTPGSANLLTRITSVSATQLTVSTTPGWLYRIESSSNLIDWIPQGSAEPAISPSLTLPVPPPSNGLPFHRVRVSR
jgi:hypothetical protein